MLVSPADGVVAMEKSWPDDLPQAMGALTAAADGTIWAGTGEPNNGGGSLVFGGNGVYRYGATSAFPSAWIKISGTKM